MNQQVLIQLLPLVALFAIMYLLLIRPQKKKEKQISSMRSGVKVGDEIVTIGGIFGKVIKAKEDRLTIEVGNDKTRFEITRWAVSSILNAAADKLEKKDSTADKEDNADTTNEITEKSSEDGDGAQASVSPKRTILKKALRKENQE